VNNNNNNDNKPVSLSKLRLHRALKTMPDDEHISNYIQKYVREIQLISNQ